MELTQAQRIKDGTNVIRKLERDDGLTLQVREVFATIQGEGPHAGLPAVFIRLSGCHLACMWCDTSWDDENDNYVSYKDLAEDAFIKWGQCMGSHALPLFVLTGGEPVRQQITPFIEELLRLCPNAIIQVETAGSFYREVLSNPRVQVVVSPKTTLVHPVVSRICVGYKYIIRATDKFHKDYGTPISSTQGNTDKPVQLAVPPSHLQKSSIYLQPCDEGDVNKNSANMHKCYEISMAYGYRIGLQIHKILMLP